MRTRCIARCLLDARARGLLALSAGLCLIGAALSSRRGRGLLGLLAAGAVIAGALSVRAAEGDRRTDQPLY